MKAKLEEHFDLKELPFELTPNLRYYCDFRTHREIAAAVEHCMEKGEPIVKIIGEIGTGKTLLCRKIVNSLDEKGFMTLYVHNPLLSPESLLCAIADELEIEHDSSIRQPYLFKKIIGKLLQCYQENQRVVLFVDEAQTLSDEALESVRMLTNLESENQKLIQIVLLGQPELSDKIAQKQLRQLQQRITFSYKLEPLAANQIEYYITNRLKTAGHASGGIFTKKANELIYGASKGVPRVANVVAYRALLASYIRGNTLVDKESVKSAITDSQEIIGTVRPFLKWRKPAVIAGLATASLAFVYIVVHLNVLSVVM
jgi:MSHA biogenesis protein MshM